MTLKKGFKTLLQEAEAQIDTMSASEANETVYRCGAGGYQRRARA